MKKIILLLILVLGLFPAIKHNHVSFMGIQSASAQAISWGSSEAGSEEPTLVTNATSGDNGSVSATANLTDCDACTEKDLDWSITNSSNVDITNDVTFTQNNTTTNAFTSGQQVVISGLGPDTYDVCVAGQVNKPTTYEYDCQYDPDNGEYDLDCETGTQDNWTHLSLCLPVTVGGNLCTGFTPTVTVVNSITGIVSFMDPDNSNNPYSPYNIISSSAGSSPWGSDNHSGTISGLTAGTYTYQVTNVNHCTGTGTFAITGCTPYTPNAVAGSTDVGETGGSFIINDPNNNYQPYPYYSITPFPNTASDQMNGEIDGLPSGSYTYQVTDQNGCPASGSFTIGINPYNITLNEDDDDQVFGSSGGDMTIMINADNSDNNAGDYNWTCTGPTGSITGNVSGLNYVYSGLKVGSYSVTATAKDGSGSVSTPITVTIDCDISGTTFDIQPSDIDPDRGDGGEIDGASAISISPSPTASITWSIASTTATSLTGIQNDLNAKFEKVPVGSYTITGTDTYGCSVTSNTATVVQYIAIGTSTINLASNTTPSLTFCFNTTTLRTYDVNSLQTYYSNLTFNITSSSGGSVFTLTDNQDGTYTLNPSNSLTPGNYNISLLLNGIKDYDVAVIISGQPCDCSGMPNGSSYLAIGCDDNAHCYQFGSNIELFGVSGGPCTLTSLTPDENSIAVDAGNSSDVVDITKMMNCFDNIADAGATYQATISVDIPWNGHPNYLWMFNGDVGHTFLTMTKTAAGGTQTISQSFGFYPVSSLNSFSTLLGTNVAGCIHNNAGHEYNASMTWPSLTTVQFDELIFNAKNILSTNPSYDLLNNNCTGYALNVIWQLPGAPTSKTMYEYAISPPLLLTFINSPAGLYQTLQAKQLSGAPNIQIGVNLNAPPSYGPCN